MLREPQQPPDTEALEVSVTQQPTDPRKIEIPEEKKYIKIKTMNGNYMYILKCADGSYYTGSTKNLEKRLAQHQNREGANYTKKKLPVKIVYLEEFDRIDDAFQREKQVQGWSRKKKEALINGKYNELPKLSLAYRDVASRTSATVTSRFIEAP